MQRLGLCCLFIETPIRFRTTTARYVASLKEPLPHLCEIILSNLENLLLAVDFCADEGIGAFRINSGLLPLYTHPEQGYQIDELPDAEAIYEGFDNVRKRAKAQDIRLTFHPDQFVVLNSAREDVVQRSLEELEYHGLMASLLGADVITIHGGGQYGEKATALERFATNYPRLSTEVQARLTLENDDRSFTPADLLPLCQKLHLPFVYDVHHHRCLPDGLSIEEATAQALTTWKREPLFHISSPKESKNRRLHHDFIDPTDVPAFWAEIDPLTLDVEAKAKEVAVLRLRGQLKKRGWHLP